MRSHASTQPRGVRRSVPISGYGPHRSRHRRGSSATHRALGGTGGRPQWRRPSQPGTGADHRKDPMHLRHHPRPSQPLSTDTIVGAALLMADAGKSGSRCPERDSGQTTLATISTARNAGFLVLCRNTNLPRRLQRRRSARRHGADSPGCAAPLCAPGACRCRKARTPAPTSPRAMQEQRPAGQEPHRGEGTDAQDDRQDQRGPVPRVDHMADPWTHQASTSFRNSSVGLVVPVASGSSANSDGGRRGRANGSSSRPSIALA